MGAMRSPLSFMNLPKSTLILLLLALGLGGFVYFYEIRGATQKQEAAVQAKQIFSFTEEQVAALTVKTQNQTLKFERVDKSGQSSWQMKIPSNTPASGGAIAYLLDLLAKGKSDRTLSVSSPQLAEYGLNRPQANIEVKLQNNQTHRLVLGNPNFDRSFLYAQADPPAQNTGNVDVLLVSPDFGNAVNRQLSEWKSQNDNKPSTPSPNPSL